MNQLIEPTKTIQTARPQFISIATAYCLGVFNDNFFKQAAMLMAVTVGLTHLQGKATLLFALPFILFSSMAGWVADRFAKRNVVVGAKALECVAMCIGAAGIVSGNWTLILGMLFLMGLQSTFFSPALSGSIPELYPHTHIPKANGILKTLSTLSVLAGIGIAGITLDSAWPDTIILPSGKTLVAAMVIFISFSGFLASLGVNKRPVPSNNQADNQTNKQAHKHPFPKYGPLSSMKDLYTICKDPTLLIAIVADTFFYFIASLSVLIINVFGLQQLGLSQTTTSLLSVSLMLGVCTGSLIISRFTQVARWSRHLALASIGMAAGLFMAAFTPSFPASLQVGWLALSLIIAGIWAGVFIIPVTSLLQAYPKKTEKGKILAAANFSGFIGILCSGLIFNLLDHLVTPAKALSFISICLLLTAIPFILTDKKRTKKIFAELMRRILSLRYSIQIKGLDKIKTDSTRGIVFLPNHPALIDPVIVMSALLSKFDPRPLSDKNQASKPLVRQIMKIINPITIPDTKDNPKSSVKRIRQAMEEMILCLKNKEQILMYPAGRLYRSAKEDLTGNSGVEYILKNAPDTRIVLVRTKGLWGSSFSLASGKSPSIGAQWKRYLGFFLSNLGFFGPRRKVTIEFIEDRSLKALTDRKSINAYLENFYNSTPEKNTHVPYYPWQGRTPTILPEPKTDQHQGNIDRIPETTQVLVTQKIEQLCGQSIKESDRLANDLAMDSLMIMELVAWLENEFGTLISDIASLQTVSDCVLAAGGQILNTGATKLTPPPKKWFQSSGKDLTLLPDDTIASMFLNQAQHQPGKPIIADQISGPKTYREILTGIFLLKPIIEQINDEKVGIMLPASVSSVILYFATLFSGKTPVMFNWTTGPKAMAHGIEQTGVTQIFTARTLFQKIQTQGTDLSGLKTNWNYLDDMVLNSTMADKIKAMFNAIFNIRKLKTISVPKTAVILFTSGSESLPKAVPLSHENIIANLKDFSSMFSFNDTDKLMGMLPPFHSLGLTGTMLLPLCLGLKTVYHTNPTESATLAKIIETYKVTTLMGTPTFLNGILQAGKPDQLKSINLIFTGAEKCPDHVYQSVKQIIPAATLCEGYGITECSPLVSLNTIEENHPGTIGSPMPTLEYTIVDMENNCKVKKGEKGILLLRGPSVFNGYLNQANQKGFYKFENQIWYNTGDFVKESSNADTPSVLSFCGRKKRFIKLGGEMISLPAIETVLQAEHNTGNEDGPVLAIEATPNEDHPEINLFSTIPINREQANQAIKKAGLSALHNIRSIVQVDQIPVLGTGKTDYKQLKAMLA